MPLIRIDLPEGTETEKKVDGYSSKSFNDKKFRPTKAINFARH